MDGLLDNTDTEVSAPPPLTTDPNFDIIDWHPAYQSCQRYFLGVDDPNCTIGNWNWLGTDDQARDVLARVIYGFRISVLFGLILTLGSAAFGVSAGAMQGYFGGFTDLIFQRFIEIWSSIPVLYLLLIVAAVLFFFVVVPVNKLMARRKTETDVEATTKDCGHCMSSIPLAASVCAFCTRDV